ncbi:MAG: fibronectin type III domain-containing protein [Acutalibacteraceae bacterium]
MKNTRSITKAVLTVVTFIFLTFSFSVLISAEQGISVSDPDFKAVSCTTDSIKLSWQSNDEVYCFKLYSVDKETNKSTLIYKGRKTETTLSNLEPGTEYSFAVRSYLIADGKTYKSKLIKLDCNTALSKVTGITQSESTYNSYRISWNSVEGADGYLIYYYNTEKKKYVSIGQTTKATCKLTKLSSAYAYTYKIKAFSLKKDGGKIYSKASSAFVGITMPAPVTSFSASSVSTDSFTLNWKATEGSDGYRIYQFNPTTKKYSVVATVRDTFSLPISSKQTAQSYIYAIKSFAKINGKTYFSVLSDKLTVTTKPNATTVKIKQDLPGNGVLKITWSEVEGADGYLIYTSERKNSGFVLKKKVSAKTLEYTLNGLSKSNTTYIKVKAYVMSGDKMVYSANSKLIGARA